MAITSRVTKQISSPLTKRNPRPRKYASQAERQAAYRARNVMLEFRAEPKTADNITKISDTLGYPRSDVLLSMVKFALTNHDWARFGLTHKTIPTYKENPTMKPASPAQLAARAKFAAMARSGAFKTKATKRKANPSTYDPYAPRDHLAEYRTKTDAQLRHIMQDAGEAAKAMRGHSPRAEEKYLDQINDAATILWERKQKTSKRKSNPGTSDATLANWLDKIASGITFSESKLKEALQHPGITAEDKVTIKAAIKGAPYSHTDLHQAAINIRQMGQRAAKAYSELPPHLQELADKIRAKKNPAKKTVSQKISQLRHEGYPQRHAVAVALSEQRAGKVKRNPRSTKPKKYYQVSIMQEGLHKTWMPMALFLTFAEAENYSHHLAKQHKNWTIRVHDTRAM